MARCLYPIWIRSTGILRWIVKRLSKRGPPEDSRPTRFQIDPEITAPTSRDHFLQTLKQNPTCPNRKPSACSKEITNWPRKSTSLRNSTDRLRSSRSKTTKLKSKDCRPLVRHWIRRYICLRTPNERYPSSNKGFMIRKTKNNCSSKRMKLWKRKITPLMKSISLSNRDRLIWNRSWISSRRITMSWTPKNKNARKRWQNKRIML